MSLESPPAPAPLPPKKKSRRLLFVVPALIVLGLLMPIANLFRAPPAATALTLRAGDEEQTAIARILEARCLDCHSSETALPFYAKFPVAGGLIATDRETALRYIDLVGELAPSDPAASTEAALAKLEYVIERNTMPPARYVAMHWNGGLSAEERDRILKWIHGVRRQRYATPGVRESQAGENLQPLPTTLPVDARKVALGERLYHDVRLSGDNTLSCASCHGLDKGGCDQSKSSTGIGGAIGPINSPTVFNAVFNVLQFWDGRAKDLHAQAGGPVANPIEMGSNFQQVVQKLSADAPFAAEFKAVYPDGLNEATITHAIAEYEKTLITPNSRFDQYLAGKADALNADEREGLRLFRENGCSTCHAGKALGGQSFERLGRRGDYFAARGPLTDADIGRYSVTKNERDRQKFKVPTLRNVELTFPYFHDGSQATLADAVRTMAKYQAYRDFREPEVEQVVAFLRTLTGEYRGKLLR